jgi:hypothetical protein
MGTSQRSIKTMISDAELCVVMLQFQNLPIHNHAFQLKQVSFCFVLGFSIHGLSETATKLGFLIPAS